MCDLEHDWEWHGAFSPAVETPIETPRGISRRDLLRLGAFGAGAVAVSALLPGTSRASAARPSVASTAGLDGLSPFRTAQHIHARGSEGPASMTAQAAEAANWVDVMWFTDHDYKEAGIGAPTVVHFNSLTDEQLTPNPPWLWEQQNSGKLTNASSGGIESDDVSPNDPDPTGALYARAVSSTSARASLVWFANDNQLRNSMRTPAHGQTWQIDVLAREQSADGWGFLRVALSYHPAVGGQPNAYYFLEYRFGAFPRRTYKIETLDVSSDIGSDGGGDAGTITLFPGEKAILGVICVPVATGAYSTQELTFTDDIAQLFPDMIARDNSVREVWLGATSTNGTPANYCFDYLRMSRIGGQPQFTDRLAITRELAPSFPDLQLYNGTEISYGGGHRHWLGGDIELPTYGGTDRAKGAPSPSHEEIVGMILQAGGLPVLNHPYGTNGPRLSDAGAAAAAKSVVGELLDTSAEGGLKAIEVFYRMRAGASLEDHWRLFRLAVRNGLVLTATGVSDNHWGRVGSWGDETNHFITSIYAGDHGESTLLDAQARGRTFSSELGSYSGQLDLSLDGDLMGQIGIRTGTVTRSLSVQASDLPNGSSVEVWQVPVDLGGLDDEPGGVVAQIPASSFSADVASVAVDTSADYAYAVTVINEKGRRIAGSNPVWSLTAEPKRWTIPDDRRVS